MKQFKNMTMVFSDTGKAVIYFSNTLQRFNGDEYFIVAHDVEYKIESGVLYITVHGNCHGSTYFRKGTIIRRMAGDTIIKNYKYDEDFAIGKGAVYERKLLRWYKVNGKFERVIEMYIYDGYYKNLNFDQNSKKKYIISAPFIIREVEMAEKNVDDEGFSENGA